MVVHPWLWGARVDLAAFAGSALLALGIGVGAAALGVHAVSDFWWLALVLGIDVAHVHSTWFRTYFDARELLRKPFRYVAVPLAVYVVGVLAYRGSPLGFWRLLAYVAVFHFVRQQVGWVALYRARASRAAKTPNATRRWDRFFDELAIYAATLFPLFFWHARIDSRKFSWFVPGDFLALPLDRWVPVAGGFAVAALAAFSVREIWRAVVLRELALGKIVVVWTTALTWSVGIVLTNSDFVFTATNVIPHGVPYGVLLYAYARERAQRDRQGDTKVRFSSFVAFGFSGFCALLLGFAFLEEFAWDKFVDHDRPWLFGPGVELGSGLLSLAVPLLALPQAVHYVLDGFLWRRAETRNVPAQRALFGGAPTLSEGEQSVLVAEVASGVRK